MKRLLQPVLALVLLFCARDGAGGFDAFLKIEGVDGETTEAADKRKEWIEILSFSTAFKPGNPRGEGAVSSLILTKRTDKSSPVLSERCAAGTMAPSARLELVENTPSSVRFYDIRLSNVVVSAFSAATSCATPSDTPTESLSLNYSKITWTYTVRRTVSRLPQELRSANWDLAAGAGGGSTNAATFTMTGILRNGRDVLLDWQGVSGRTYEVYACANLAGPVSLQSHFIAGTNGPMSHAAPILPGAMFYVVEERP